MLHEAKWFGISLALHLAVASGLIATATRNAEITPKAIMVILDNLESPSLPQHKESQTPVRAVVRPVAPVVPAALAEVKSEAIKSEQLPHALQPVLAASSATNYSPETNQLKEVANVSPQEKVNVPDRPTPVNSVSHSIPPAKEGHPAPEKAQQRYLKEHFSYISDLISKQIVYPTMARKMNWSGKVVVSFTIVEDGSVHAIRVLQTSGFPILDKSALETVRRVAPFPRPPVRAEIVVPINFRMNH